MTPKNQSIIANVFVAIQAAIIIYGLFLFQNLLGLSGAAAAQSEIGAIFPFFLASLVSVVVFLVFVPVYFIFRPKILKSFCIKMIISFFAPLVLLLLFFLFLRLS